MGGLLSSILPCCVKNEEEESNPNQRLIDKNESRPSYHSEAQTVPGSETRTLTETSTTSTKSIYYTPSSSFKDTTGTSVEL